MKSALEGKVIVSCAPNGARRTKVDHPALPMTTPEIAAAAVEIRNAGACLLHLHVRDRDGAHSLDRQRYEDAINAIHDLVGHDLIVQITTEACGQFSIDTQMDVVRLVGPEAASCALRELCPNDKAIPRYAKFLSECRDEGIWVQHILYDDVDAHRFMRLREEGVIEGTAPFVLLVIGSYAGPPMASDPESLLTRAAPFVRDNTMLWGVCAFGCHEHPVAVAAAALGGHPRIGFENNTLRSDGSQAKSNSEQVLSFVNALPAMGRTAASADEVRAARLYV